jgi:hypothetical protein
MKRFAFLLTVVATFFVTAAFSQEKKMTSPPATAEGTIGNVKVTVKYHQPSARGRKIMGGLVPFGEVWRTGANETTTIEFSGPVKLEGKEVAKGTYALFTIPGENEWIIILNKTIGWGHFKYKQEEDVVRVNAKPKKSDGFVETFNITVGKNGLELKWENTVVPVKIQG